MSTCCSSKNNVQAGAHIETSSQIAPLQGDKARAQKGQLWLWTCLGVTLGLLLIGVTWLLHYQVSWANPEPEIQISRNTACTGVKPRAVMTSDGEWLATVWIEGDASSGQCRDSGKAVLRRAQRSDTTYNWQEPQTIMEGQANADNACVTHADVRVYGATAHIITVKRAPCLGENPSSSVQYFSCDLPTGNCIAPESITWNSNVGQIITDAELYADDNGKLHVVYDMGTIGAANSSEIYYLRKIDDSWQEAPGTNLSTGVWIEGAFVDYAAYAPRVDGSGGRLHVVWDAHTLSGGGFPLYRYCHTDTGTCPVEGGPKQINPQWSGDMGTYSLPIIAAHGNRVLTIWHYCSEDPFEAPFCDKFQLIYSRSDDNGSNFIAPQISEDAVGGSYPYNPGTGFPSTDASNTAYNNHLQPALALDASGLPWVAWHSANNSIYSAYMITSTIAISQTELAFNWEYQTGWSIGENNLDRARVSPVILISYQPTTSGMHLIYMAKNASGSDHYQVYYHYLQEAETPTETPTETPSETPSETPTITPEPEDLLIYLPLIAKVYSDNQP